MCPWVVSSVEGDVGGAQLMGCGDALYDYSLSLPKGKYTIKLQARRADRGGNLQRLKDFFSESPGQNLALTSLFVQY